MRRALSALAFTLGLLCSPAFAGPASEPMDADTVPSPGDERSLLIIDSGRLLVMMDQSKAALDLLTPDGTRAEPPPAAAQRAYAFQELVAAVLHYNLLQQKACRARIAAPERCAGPYLPAWLKDPPGQDHGEVQLRAMVEDASQHLVPFWSDVCGKGRAASKDDQFCDLE